MNLCLISKLSSKVSYVQTTLVKEIFENEGSKLHVARSPGYQVSRMRGGGKLIRMSNPCANVRNIEDYPFSQITSNDDKPPENS